MPNESNGFIGLDEVMSGAITERFNHALTEVLENIADLNTDAEKARKITLVLTIKPNEERDIAAFKAEAKTSLVARKAVATLLAIGTDGNGIVHASEITKQTPGQIDIEGNEFNPKVRPIAGLKTGGSNHD